MESFKRALLIALSRVLTAAGVALVVYGLLAATSLEGGGNAFFGGLAFMAVAANLRYFGSAIWWIEHWGVIHRTKWWPYILVN